LILLAAFALMLAVIPSAFGAEDPDVISRSYPLGTGFQLYDSAATNSGLVTTTAQIGGGGSGVSPRIFCKWELPDMDSAAPNIPFIQYSDDPTPSSVANHKAGLDQLNPWDDDDLGPAFPCALTAPDGFPEYVQPTPYGTIQVRANAEDQPEERVIELWGAVGPVSVDDVYWKVFHPDGSIKIQVHGTVVEGCNTELGATAGNAVLTPGSMFWAANGTDQLTNAAITDFSKGLVAACEQDQLNYWKAEFDLSKHQPCGEYLVELTAVNGDLETSITNSLDVICFHQLEIDFAGGVNFGQIEAYPVTNYKSGDLNFVNGDNFPTVKNTGSGGMEVGVEFFTMYQNGIPGPKFIDTFDAKFGITPAQLVVRDPITASDSPNFPLTTNIAWFGTNDYQTLCANEVGKLDLSIHPSITSGTGSFTGAMRVWARPDTATDNTNNYFVNPGQGVVVPTPLYTCANDNGVWGGYHDYGPNNVPNGNGYSGTPFGAQFDDQYYNPANNGTLDASSEAGSSNQRSIWNQ
jgi:hypothetical protein